MRVKASKPLFTVILRSGENWTVEAEWPDGTIERAAEVKSALDAWSWIHSAADSWIAGRISSAPDYVATMTACGTPQTSDDVRRESVVGGEAEDLAGLIPHGVKRYWARRPQHWSPPWLPSAMSSNEWPPRAQPLYATRF